MNKSDFENETSYFVRQSRVRKVPILNMCVTGFTSDQETRILGNYTVLTDKLVLESSKFVWEGESHVNNSAALFNRQSENQS